MQVKATKEAVEAAAAQLIAQGENVTLDAVRRITGGSNSTVIRLLREWRAANEGHEAVLSGSDLSAETADADELAVIDGTAQKIRQAVEDMARHFQRGCAQRLADQQRAHDALLTQERERHARAVSAALERQARAEAELDAVATESEERAQKVEQLLAENAALEQERDDARVQEGVLRKELSDERTAHERAVAQADTRLAAAKLRGDQAEAQANLLREAAPKFEERVSCLSDRLEAVRRDLDAANAEVAEQRHRAALAEAMADEVAKRAAQAEEIVADLRKRLAPGPKSSGKS